MKKAKQIHEQFLAITNTVNKGQRITLIFNQKKKKKKEAQICELTIKNISETQLIK